MRRNLPPCISERNLVCNGNVLEFFIGREVTPMVTKYKYLGSVIDEFWICMQCGWSG